MGHDGFEGAATVFAVAGNFCGFTVLTGTGEVTEHSFSTGNFTRVEWYEFVAVFTVAVQ